MTWRGWTAPVLVAGPCAIEGTDADLTIGEALAELSRRFELHVVFKGSFDKANRTMADARRGLGFEAGLAALARVRKETGLPVITDVHETVQVVAVAEVVDALQIPAFLCRQTDLLVAAGKTGRPVNIKKGQWMTPEAMVGAVDKVRAGGGGEKTEIAVTERGTFFGYGDLVVDMRSFRRLAQATGCPVLFDATHSVQRPGTGRDGATGGERRDVEPLALAAVGAGAHGLFVETHPDPSSADSDRETMLPLDRLEPLVERSLRVWESVHEGATAGA